MRNKQKGITLVALIITVIILLILAGISIASLTNSGLFEKAKLAEQKSNEAQEKEEGILADYENKIGEYVDASRDTVTISKEEYNMLKNANSYSTTEKVVGTWIDGKPVYQRTYVGNIPNAAIGNFVGLEGNYDTLISLNGSIQHSTGYWLSVEVCEFTYMVLSSDKTQIKWHSEDYLNRPCKITMRYTKSTDQVPTEN